MQNNPEKVTVRLVTRRCQCVCSVLCDSAAAWLLDTSEAPATVFGQSGPVLERGYCGCVVDRKESDIVLETKVDALLTCTLLLLLLLFLFCLSFLQKVLA